MIQNIKDYFADLLNENAKDNSSNKKTIELATAALMIEISLADDHIHEDERNTIKGLLTQNFSLGSEEVDELINLAENEVNHAVSLHEFTSLINDTLAIPDKIKIIENLWHVACADSVIDKYEEYYIRKIADLLYISHSDYIQSKLKASE